MKKFTTKTFNIPELVGISAKNIEEHLKLYTGYVNNANTVLEQVDMLHKDSEKNTYALGELMRRFSFEYNGMRNHEVYFGTLEGGSKPISTDSGLHKAIETEWGSYDTWLSNFKHLGTTRGIGWAMLWYDRREERLLMSWVDEQHLGQLNDCTIILAMDMWEHSYVADYQPSGKKKYIEDFMTNLNWSAVEKNFENVRR
ncbi:MAG: Fe-Mn family superoxide dismutase [Candidatus Paceibacterota bacterium]